MTTELPALGPLSQIATRTGSDWASEWRISRAREFIARANETLGLKVPTSEVCLLWSQFADRALTEAFNEVSKQVPLSTELGLFAYGKLGSRELNLSSDVDLVLVALEDDAKLSEWVRTFRRLLQDNTEFGFCFRLDFDLRPGGRLGSLVPTVAQFEDYFSNYGEAWERLAFTRFRAICGSSQVLESCFALSQKFTYRKHLDFTLMEDLKVLRQRIHEQNWRRSENGAIDLKLGLGGIRDLELFIHTQQVIHGGRDPRLRVASTEQALRLMLEREILSEADVDFLSRHYWKLRHFENLLQAATDQQTQILKADDWSDLVGEPERTELKGQMQKCQDLVSGLLGEVESGVLSLPESETEQREWLMGLGYSESVIIEVWTQLLSKGVLSRQPERDDLYRKRFLFAMTERLAHCSLNRDLALRILNDFLRAIRAKATFFHLLLQKTELLDRLVFLFSSSTYLSRILIQRPELLDSFLYQAQELEAGLDWDQLLSRLLEKKLLTEMTAGLEFMGNQDLETLTTRLTAVADEVVQSILDKLRDEYPSNLQVIAMGKWGGRELGLRSDLDLVLITLAPPEDADYKVARRLISRLTEAQKGGDLYQLDFRLKPQGKGGPLLTTKAELLRYLEQEAEPWERQAYLKARPLGEGLKIEELHHALFKRPLTSENWDELERIHQALLQKAKGEADLKYVAGGMVETEFIVQLMRFNSASKPISTSTLEELQALTAFDSRWVSVKTHYRQLRIWEQSLQLLSSRPHFALNENSEDLLSLAALTQADPAILLRRIHNQLQENAALVRPLDPRLSRG